MNKQTTIDQLIQMHMSAMAFAYRDQEEDVRSSSMPFDERFAFLVDVEYTQRRQNKRARLRRQARLPEPDAHIQDVLYYPDRKLDRERMLNLSLCHWVENHQTVLLTGASGAGKSWIASALGNAAIDRFHTVVYERMPEMLDKMASPKDEIWQKEKNRLVKGNLLIIDDFLLEPVNVAYARELLEVIEPTYKNGSLIICSQFSAAGWHKNILSEPIADAILDRVTARCHVVHIEGDESMRKRIAQKPTI